jgi:hypothetical protein
MTGLGAHAWPGTVCANLSPKLIGRVTMRHIASVFDSAIPSPLTMTFAAAWTVMVLGMWYIG